MSSSRTTLVSITLPKNLVELSNKYVPKRQRSRLFARFLKSYIRHAKEKQDEEAYRKAFSDPTLIAEMNEINQEFESIEKDLITEE